MNNNLLLKQIEEILKTNTDSSYYHITAMSNIRALLYDNMKDLNWLGFYILENDFYENSDGIFEVCDFYKKLITESPPDFKKGIVQ